MAWENGDGRSGDEGTSTSRDKKLWPVETQPKNQQNRFVLLVSEQPSEMCSWNIRHTIHQLNTHSYVRLMALLFTQICITILPEVASTRHTLSVMTLFPRVNSSSTRWKEPGTRGEKRACTPQLSHEVNMSSFSSSHIPSLYSSSSRWRCPSWQNTSPRKLFVCGPVERSSWSWLIPCQCGGRGKGGGEGGREKGGREGGEG